MNTKIGQRLVAHIRPRIGAWQLIWGVALACAAVLDEASYERFVKSLLFR